MVKVFLMQVEFSGESESKGVMDLVAAAFGRPFPVAPAALEAAQVAARPRRIAAPVVVEAEAVKPAPVPAPARGRKQRVKKAEAPAERKTSGINDLIRGALAKREMSVTEMHEYFAGQKQQLERKQVYQGTFFLRQIGDVEKAPGTEDRGTDCSWRLTAQGRAR